MSYIISASISSGGTGDIARVEVAAISAGLQTQIDNLGTTYSNSNSYNSYIQSQTYINTVIY